MTPAATILVVDDDADLREAVTLVLRMFGFRVEGAASGVEALEVLRLQLPDVILLDMKMPVMDGWQFARVARERYGAKLPPLLVLTAAANPAARAQEIGAQGWLGKPFELDELHDEIRKLLPPGAKSDGPAP